MTNQPSPATLALMIRGSAPLLLRFLRGFDESNRTLQRPEMPNHPIWILGHTAFTMARFGHLAGGPVPNEKDFAPEDGSDGAQNSAIRFRADDVMKDSTPVGDPDFYPSLARGQEIFSRAIEELACVLESLPTERLQETVLWNGDPLRIDALAIRLCFHNGLHAGQLTDLRRGAGFDRVLPTSPVAAKQSRPS